MAFQQMDFTDNINQTLLNEPLPTNNIAGDLPTDKKGLNSAQIEGIFSGAESLIETGAGAITGAMEQREVEAARKQARQLADIRRGDVLETRNIQNQIKTKSIEQQEKQQVLNEQAYNINRQFQKFQKAFKTSIEAQNQLQNAAQSISGAYKKNPNIINFLKRYIQ